MRLLLAIALALATTLCAAQSGKRHDGQPRQMSPEERQRMREDMREAYGKRGERPEKARQMSAEEREKLRRDIQDANRNLKR
jgi:hypothetical protein